MKFVAEIRFEQPLDKESIERYHNSTNSELEGLINELEKGIKGIIHNEISKEAINVKVEINIV
jgi:hypothetical protein